MKRLITGLTLASVVLAAGIYEANARPPYAAKEQKPCGYCHVNPAGGGPRNFRGQFYGANGLSFELFNEDREAALAHVVSGSNGDDSIAKGAYIASVTAPADRAITGRTNMSPVLVVFLNNTADDATKTAVKTLGKISDAYGRGLAVVGVIEGDRETALKLTSDLGNVIRILPDVEGAAMKKYKGQMGFDMALVPKFDQNDTPPIGYYQGFSKQTIEKIIDSLGNQGVSGKTVDTADISPKPLRGAKLGG